MANKTGLFGNQVLFLPKRNQKKAAQSIFVQKKTFIQKTRAYNVDEIDARYQFHQYFTSILSVSKHFLKLLCVLNLALQFFGKGLSA